MSPLARLLSLLLLLPLSRAETVCPAVARCLSGPDCPLLPIPPSSLPPLEGPAGYALTPLRPAVYSFYAAAYSALILYTSERLTVVDFPNPAVARDGSYLLNAAVQEVLRRRRPKRIDMVYGHRHIDHIGGAPRFADFVADNYPDAQLFVWATAETRDFLASNPASKIPKPNVIVGDRGRSVNLSSSLNLKLLLVGGHTQADLAAHVLPSNDAPGILHYVDVITPGFAPFIDFAITIDLARYIEVHDELLRLDFEKLSAGHGRLGTKEDIRLNLEYTLDTFKCAKEAADEVTPQQMQQAGLDRLDDPTAPQYRNEQWALKTIVDLEGDICRKKLIRKWGCRLAVVDVFGMSHCQKAFFFGTTEQE